MFGLVGCVASFIYVGLRVFIRCKLRGGQQTHVAALESAVLRTLLLVCVCVCVCVVVCMYVASILCC